MNDEAWPEEPGERDDAAADDRAWADDPIPWADAPSAAESAASFCDQIKRGIWPIRVPMALEIYAEGSSPQVLRRGQGPRVSGQLRLDAAAITDRMHDL